MLAEIDNVLSEENIKNLLKNCAQFVIKQINEQNIAYEDEIAKRIGEMSGKLMAEMERIGQSWEKKKSKIYFWNYLFSMTNFFIFYILNWSCYAHKNKNTVL